MRFSTRCSLIISLILLTGCGEQNVYQEPPPPNVKVASPLVQTVTNYIEETARTEAVALVDVRARVEGNLESVNFEPGRDVAQGDLLYEIEPQLYDARVDSAQADIMVQQARLKEAELNKNRQENIRAKDAGATSEAAVIAAQAEFESAKAAVAQAEAQLKQAQIDQQYTKILAPIAGRVGKTLVKEGNLVGRGGEATMLTTIIDYDPIFANFYLSERRLLELIDATAEGGKDIKEIPIFLNRETDADFPFEGRLEYTDSAINQKMGTILMRGIFPNERRQILPGMFVTIRLPISKRENAVLIPERAVGADQGGRFVLVVDSENNVERRNVTLGTKIGALVVIKEGLAAEDTVITDGLQRARAGAKVTPERIEVTSGEQAAESVQTDSTKPPSPPAASTDDVAKPSTVIETESAKVATPTTENLPAEQATPPSP